MSQFDQYMRDAQQTISGVMGQTLKFKRGVNWFTVCGFAGQSEFPQSPDEATFGIASRSRDFHFLACDLVLNDEVIEPQEGDLIEEQVGSATHVHRVSRPDGGEQVFRYSDTGRQKIRVHTVLKVIQ